MRTGIINLLVDTVPLLNRSKKVDEFLPMRPPDISTSRESCRGAGVLRCEKSRASAVAADSLQRAAEHCPWLKAMVDTGEIFHPLRWSPQQAVQLLKDVPALESAGVVGRMPASWRMNRPARPQVKATAGGNTPSQADQNGQATAGRYAHRSHRYAHRKPAKRPVVDLRLHQSRALGIVEGIFVLRQTLRRPTA